MSQAITATWTSIVILGLAATANGTEPAKVQQPTAQEVMEKTEAAIKRVKSVEYRLAQRGHADAPDAPPKIEGRVVLSGPAKNMWADKFRAELRIRKPDVAEPEKLVMGTDGEIVYLIDEKEKKVYADMDPGVLGSRMFTMMETVVSSFVSPDPFEYEKKAEKIELKEPVKVGDEECHVLRFQLGRGNEIVWFVAQSDGLPRRLDWLFKGPDGAVMGSRTELQGLRVNAPLDADAFRLVVPQGYAKTDDFAP